MDLNFKKKIETSLSITLSRPISIIYKINLI